MRLYFYAVARFIEIEKANANVRIKEGATAIAKARADYQRALAELNLHTKQHGC